MRATLDATACRPLNSQRPLILRYLIPTAAPLTTESDHREPSAGHLICDPARHRTDIPSKFRRAFPEVRIPRTRFSMNGPHAVYRHIAPPFNVTGAAASSASWMRCRPDWFRVSWSPCPISHQNSIRVHLISQQVPCRTRRVLPVIRHSTVLLNDPTPAPSISPSSNAIPDHCVGVQRLMT